MRPLKKGAIVYSSLDTGTQKQESCTAAPSTVELLGSPVRKDDPERGMGAGSLC